MNTPVLELSEVHRAYAPDREALRGLCLDVGPGEVVGLIGPNGAGKTTLLRIAAGLLEPDRGSVRVFGLDPWVHPLEVKRRYGYVAESQAVPARCRVADLLALHREVYPTWDAALERDLMSRLGVAESARLSSLSKGQARKVLLLCAIAHRPELLILDEPAGGLDPAARREFLELSIELLNSRGSTILFSSHHMSDVERIASRIVVIESGEKLIDAELDAFQQEHCLVVLPARPAAPAALERVPGFIRSRVRGDSLYAVFRRESQDVERELTGDLRLPEVRCTRTSLEEMFVALVGGQA